MFVRDQMIQDVVTVTPATSVPEALKTMQEHSIKRLPVMQNEKLVGIVTESALLKVSPSPATSLSIFEINFLVAKMTIKEVMTKKPFTISPDATIEEAALLMRNKKISGLPVLDNGKLIGIISESDLFDAMIELFGLKRAGKRLTVEVKDIPGVLAQLANILKGLNINIINVANRKRKDNTVEIIVRLDITDEAKCVAALAEHGFKVTHIN